MYDIGDLGGDDVFPAAINASGQIAGTALDTYFGQFTAFVTGPKGKGLGYVRGVAIESFANAINDSGQVAGANCLIYCNPFISVPGGFITEYLLPVSTQQETRSTGITPNGVITGYYTYGTTVTSFIAVPGTRQVQTFSAFGGETRATAMNDLGQIAGIGKFPGSDVEHVFLREPDATSSLDLGTPTTGKLAVRSLNSQGVIAGHAERAKGVLPFTYSTHSQEFVLKRTLGGTYGSAYAVAKDGSIAGGSSLADGDLRAFVAGSDGVPYDINPLIVNRPAGVALKKVTAINKKGQMAAQGNDRRGYIVCPTEECR